MEFNPSISLFSSAKSNKPVPMVPTLSAMLENIKNGTYKTEIEALRKSKLKAERDELKKQLRAVTWSGTFTKRNAECLDKYSYILCHDIDKLSQDELNLIKRRLSDCTYVYAVFVSPSGNGLKVLFRAHENIVVVSEMGECLMNETHLNFWHATAKYLDENYNITVDPATKDICRLCFVSFDQDLYYNPDVSIIDHDFIERYAQMQLELPQETIVLKTVEIDNNADDLTWMLQKCHEVATDAQNRSDRKDYNYYINAFAIQANRYGISQTDCAYAIAGFCNWNSPDRNDVATVKSVYSKFSTENGKYLENGKPKRPRTENKTAQDKKAAKHGTPAPAKKESKYNTDVRFWYSVDKIGKNGDVVGTEYKYSYDDAITFLENNGFFKYSLGNNKYQLIHVDFKNNIVEIVNELRVKEFMIEFLKEIPDDDDDAWKEYKQVREMFRRGAKNYVSSNVLDGLEYYKPVFKRDTPDTAYIYFKNCFLEITKEQIKQKGYSELQGFIWRSQIKDFDFSLDDGATSHFEQYLQLAIIGRKLKEGDEYTELDKKKLLSVNTSIGYMIHQYKRPALAKAVIAVDKKKRTIGEPNGRTGKSLLGKGLAKMLNQCFMDGPNFKFDYDFAWQKVEADTQFINFNDVPKNFPFDRLFGMITEELTINKKKIENIVIPFSEAPKFYINTNYSLKGDGESNKGRQQIIEFSDFFNSKHSPYNEFNEMFFDDWKNEEWNRFYTYMVHCVKVYLENSLVDFPLENYGLNKLIDAAGEDFILFMDEHIIDNGNKGTIRLELKKLFERYQEENKPPAYYKQNTFTKQVKDWANVRGYVINAHKNGERDRINGVDFYTFMPLGGGDIAIQPITTLEKTNDTEQGHLPF